MAFWKEQPPRTGNLRSIWKDGSFVVFDRNGNEVLKINGETNKVAAQLPAGSITSADIESNGLSSGSFALDTVQVATVSLTNAELKDLAANPKELVAAPGAGKFIEFLGATLFHDYGSEVLTGNHAMTIGLDDGTVAVAAEIAHGDFAHKDGDHVYSVKAAVAFNDTAANTLNKNLALKSADAYGGNASDNTVWTVHVAYRIIDFS